MIALQAIETRYHGPTNNKGSRISARTPGGARLFISYPHEFSGIDCHAEAAEKLARQLEWIKSEDVFADHFAPGALRDSYVFVNVGVRS